MLGTALALARKNIAVFPCRARDKRPATERGLKDATTDKDVIRAWWRERPDYNVAIATGALELFVVDVDGVDAELELRKLEAENGALPPTVEASPRAADIVLQNAGRAGAQFHRKIAPGIDVRGDGGYVLAPPTSTRAAVRTRGLSIAPTLSQKRRTGCWPGLPTHNGNGEATPPAEWRELVAGGVDEGQRDCTVAKLSGHLLRRFLDPFVVLELMQCWNATRCRPPLAEEDITRIVEFICAKELRRRGHAR